MTTGWTKLPATEPNLNVPPQTNAEKGWVTIATFDDPDQIGLDDALLMGHCGCDLGQYDANNKLTNLPTDIRTRWLRGNGDPTAYQTHAVGTIRPWAGGVPYPEKISLDDLPLRFQIWQKGGVMVVRKVVPAIFVPAPYIAASLELAVK